jgi:hypothetical protein
MIFGPTFRVKAHFSGAILGSALELRMAVRTVAAQFAVAMETICTGHWKISPRDAISMATAVEDLIE